MGNDEREQTLNQLLTELDGFESEKDAGPVICIAATNRPDVSRSCLILPLFPVSIPSFHYMSSCVVTSLALWKQIFVCASPAIAAAQMLHHGGRICL